jgi:intein/homing endonuclease
MPKTEVHELPTVYQNFIHASRYARWSDEIKRRETWNETVARYFDFFTNHLQENHNFKLSTKLRNEIEQSVLELNTMPSMRCLMTAGPALEKENIAGYNCSSVAIDHPRAFDEILYILMCGCFHEDTLIKTKKGNKKIKDVSIDDEVLSFDIENNKFEYIKPERVVETPHSLEKPKLELEFEDGSIIKCTTDHEFFTTNRGWVKAEDLEENDDIKNYHEIL